MSRRLEKGNRNSYFRKEAIDPQNVVTADLIHGGKIEKVTGIQAGTYISNSDGLTTDTKNLFLSATGADCSLLYFYDHENKAIGITHVGWRGLLAGVVVNTVKSFTENFASSPENLLVGISPGIRSCHFKISSSDTIKYKEYPDFIFERGDKTFIDLVGIIKSQLFRKGVSEKNIEDSGICTYCNEQDFFSYRRDKPKEVQPMVGYIGLV